ncbi:MAG: T9SS type A sorting domain-containing protein, partial [Maribacter sp.]
VEVTVTEDGMPSESATVTFTWNVTENEVFEVDRDEMFIAPNPAGGSTQVFINLENQAPMLGIYIYDLSGRLVKEYNYLDSISGNGGYEVFVGDLRNGVYTVYAFIQGINEPFVKKLVVRN